MAHVPRMSIAAWLTLLIAAGPAQAAWLSEVFLGEASDIGAPNAVEVAGLAEADELELVVIDATNADRLGDVLQIIRFTATEPLHLIGDGPWPDTAWTYPLTDGGDGVTLDLTEATGGEHDRLDLAGARRLHLYAGTTNLAPATNVFTPELQDYLFESAVLLDTLSFAPDGAAARRTADEHVLDTHAGWVFVRPDGYQSMPADAQWLVGSPNADGHLAGPALPAKVTPGRANPHFEDIVIPAPGSLSAMLIAAGVLACRRRRWSPRA